MKKIITTILFITSYFLVVNAQYTKLLDFSGTTKGSSPNGALISDGTFFYGVSTSGGIGVGVIFKIKPDGTGYSKLFDFLGGSEGSTPNGNLIYDGTFLYGMTQGGGLYSYGTIFKIKPDGTGFSKVHDFNQQTAQNGSYPWGSLISDGTFLYGMTSAGGTGTCGNIGCGIIFKIKPDGTGYSKLLDFTGTNGSSSIGSLISDGTFLYGMTNNGGSNNVGVIFKIKHDGTGYSNLLDFSGGLNGNSPNGSLISEGTFLYGMTPAGGTNNNGVIFKIKPDGTEHSIIYDFPQGGPNGSYPYGSLISDGTFLYGMTYGDMESVFKIQLDGSGYYKMYEFSLGSLNGSGPQGSLIINGNFLYGMTYYGGIYGEGTIFKLGISTDISENNMASSFNLYPNPNNGRFTIETKKNDYVLNITNILGEIVYKSEIKNQKSEIDLSKLPAGLYLINIETEIGTGIQKLIIHH